MSKNNLPKLTLSLTNGEVAMEIIYFLLIIVLTYAGICKFINYKVFHFELLISPDTRPLAGLLAWSIPSAEIIIALLLTLRKSRLIGLYISAVLFAGYILAIFEFRSYVPSISGGFFSIITFAQRLWIDIIFTFLSIAGILLKSKLAQRIYLK